MMDAEAMAPSGRGWSGFPFRKGRAVPERCPDPKRRDLAVVGGRSAEPSDLDVPASSTRPRPSAWSSPPGRLFVHRARRLVALQGDTKTREARFLDAHRRPRLRSGTVCDHPRSGEPP
jgi:hypothetical protein